MKRREWLAHGLGEDVDRALRRIEAIEDVVAVAVMPDVHLASDVCIGTVTATRDTLVPNAVGGDIGCGMCAIRFDVDADSVDDRDTAAAILAGLYERVPIKRHKRGEEPAWPDLPELSEPRLETKDARLQIGTVGRGNHFVELQRDDEGALWAMVHTGSRGMGQAIRQHHLERCVAGVVRTLSATTEKGAAYLADVAWARAYARANRAAILDRLQTILGDVLGASAVEDSFVDADHNHVQRETHGEPLWVHRKGAQSAREGERGIIPGSMGSASYHVVGRGCADALCSSAHGAGRAMSRSEARKKISRKKLAEDTEGVWFDRRLMGKLREEAPAAYKDISAVMRAQKDLVRIVRELRPVLVYKGA